MPLPQYILFDVDDTLYPSTSPVWPLMHARITNYIVEKLNMTPADAEMLRLKYRNLYGTSTRGLHLHNNVDVFDYLDYVHDVPLKTLLNPDWELDNILRQIPATKCLFTNGSRNHAHNVADALGIRAHFAHIFAIEDFELHSKPDPRGYHLALNTLQTDGAACMMIEDSPHNLITAKELGMTTVLIAPPNPKPMPMADYVITRVHEIGDVWRKLMTHD